MLPGMIRHGKRTLVDKPFAVGWPGVGDRKHQSSDEVSVSDGTGACCGPQVLLSVIPILSGTRWIAHVGQSGMLWIDQNSCLLYLLDNEISPP